MGTGRPKRSHLRIGRYRDKLYSPGVSLVVLPLGQRAVQAQRGIQGHSGSHSLFYG